MRWVSAVILAAVALAGCGQSASASGRVSAGVAAARSAAASTAANGPGAVLSVTTTTAAVSVTPARRHAVHGRPPRRPRGPAPGTLPQTPAEPPATSPQLHAEMADFWRAVQVGRVWPGVPAFFPEAAYVQIKAISDPQADWRNRLLGDYVLDVKAAHQLLGADPRAAKLLGVRVPESYAHWVPPNVCYNSSGYWEVPNSRVVYSAHGQVRSFGIASMISWRGVWYIVHLGAVLRSVNAGVVDDPAVGPGVSAYSGTC